MLTGLPLQAAEAPKGQITLAGEFGSGAAFDDEVESSGSVVGNYASDAPESGLYAGLGVRFSFGHK